MPRVMSLVGSAFAGNMDALCPCLTNCPTMDVGRFRDKGMELLTEGNALDNSGSYAEAISKYEQGIEQILFYIRCESTRAMHSTVLPCLQDSQSQCSQCHRRCAFGVHVSGRGGNGQ